MAADLPAVPEFERLCSLVRDGGVGRQVTGGTVTTVRLRAAQALMIVSTYFRLLRHIVSRAWVRSWVRSRGRSQGFQNVLSASRRSS